MTTARDQIFSSFRFVGGPASFEDLFHGFRDEDEDDESELRVELDDLVGDGLLATRGGVLREKTFNTTDDGEAAIKRWAKQKFSPRRVFLAHGHDHALLREVEITLRQRFTDLLEIVVLQDQPSRGAETIFAKFQRLAPEPRDFFVGLFTADDVAASRAAPTKKKPRARQNVPAEWFYAAAQIGVGHCFILKDDGVELPSDMSGMIYISTSGQWKHELLRDVAAALADV